MPRPVCTQRVSSSFSTVRVAGEESVRRAARRCFERCRRTVGQRSEVRPLAAASVLVHDEDGLRRLVCSTCRAQRGLGKNVPRLGRRGVCFGHEDAC